jgi:signal transduction histidine kinase
MKETEIKYETEKKQKENEILKRKQQINELKIEKNRNQLYYLIAISIILLIMAAVIYNRYLYKQKVNKRLEYTNSKLAESENNLKDLVATRDKFFSIIAHDLRNPLSSLTIVSEMLDENIGNISPEKLKYYLGSMSSATGGLLNLIENLLNWARTQTGTIKYNPEKVNLTNIVNQNISLLKLTADKKKISFQNNINTAVFVIADINLLTAVIRNLLSNAMKFTEESGSIFISVSETDKYYKISIRDTGIGMSKNDLKKLFRIDVDTQTIGESSEKGTGLGLILCNEFVKKNKGEIYAESKLNVGSTFSFTIKK